MKIFLPTILACKKKQLPIDVKTMLPLKNGKKIFFNNDISEYRFQEEMPIFARKNYQCCVEKLYEQFNNILKESGETKIIIIFYEKKTTKDYLGYPSIPQISIVTDETELIKKIFEDSIKYKVFPLFFVSKAGLLLIPTDHLDLFMASSNKKDYSSVVDFQCFSVAEWT